MVLVVSTDEILVEGRRIASVSQVMATTDDLIPALSAELAVLGQRQAVRSDNRARQATEGQAVTILADKQMPYALLRKVMVTCARANFHDCLLYTSTVVRQYDLGSMPATVLIDRDGRVRHLHRGYREGIETTYEQQIRELVKE